MISLTTSKLHFDSKKYTKAMQREVQNVIREGVRAFAEEAANRAGGSGVPVVSGMAKGIFRAKVKRFSGATGTMENYIGADIPIAPKTDKKKYKGMKKTPKLGAGMSAYDFYMSPKGQKFSFTFHTNVEHFLINEFNARGYGPNKKGTPWYVLTAGKRAFETYITNNLKRRIPKINDYIIQEGVV